MTWSSNNFSIQYCNKDEAILESLQLYQVLHKLIMLKLLILF